MSNELSEYRALINKLAPMLEQAAFKRLFEDVTKDLSNEKRFLIKMEIQRLAKPCLRVLDLRSKVPQPCEFVTYKGITHYLDAKSSKLFEEQTRAYGKYTFGV
ncbi:MAG: PilZ domain-containing protein, partial [Glaciecola sp.]